MIHAQATENISVGDIIVIHKGKAYKYSPCQCNMRIKLVGDGCMACNLEYWKDMLEVK